MISAPEKILAAVDRLSGNQDFLTLIAFMESQLKDRTFNLISGVTPVLIHQDQGYAQALMDILQMISSARESLSSLG